MRDRGRRGQGRGPRSRSGSDSFHTPREFESRPPAERTRPAPYPERPRPSTFELFRTSRPVIGVVHLKPLPGSPGYGGSFLELLDHALTDARSIEAGGAAGLIVENFGDAPFYPDQVPPETIAAMTRLVTEIRKAVRIPVGVNVLRNDARGGVAVAAATGAGFVRVNVHTGVAVADQGLLVGRAFESIRLREILRSRTLIFADLRVKHAAPLAMRDIALEAEEMVRRGRADALILTGTSTGSPADLGQLAAIRDAVPGVSVLVGSGVDRSNIEAVLKAADGCIVGTAIKVDGEIDAPVDVDRLRELTRFADSLAPRAPVERPVFDRPAYERAPEPAPPRFEDRPERPRFEDRPPREERPRRDDRPRREDRPPRAGFDRPRREERVPRTDGDFGRSAPPAPGPAYVSGVPVWEPRGSDEVIDLPEAAPVTNGGGEAWEPVERGPSMEPAAEAPPAAVTASEEPHFGRGVHRKKRR